MKLARSFAALRMTLVLVALVGCNATPKSEQTTEPAKATSTNGDPSVNTGAPVGAARGREPFVTVPRIGRGDVPTAVHVDVYQLSVPYGTVSRNEKFWKRIDENCVDPTTYDTLFTNGIRVGLAPTAEWDHFKSIMEEHPAVTRMDSVVSMDGKTVELAMGKNAARRDIFYLDSAKVMQGRTYDVNDENYLGMVLQPAPRKPQTVRVTLCPAVRAARKRLEYSQLNREEPEVTYVRPERLYDLNLRVDVPVDSFLVVAPSGEATWSTSVGNAFFVTSGTAERMETVLLMVPRIVRMELGEVSGPTTRQAAQAAKK